MGSRRRGLNEYEEVFVNELGTVTRQICRPPKYSQVHHGW